MVKHNGGMTDEKDHFNFINPYDAFHCGDRPAV